MCYVPAVAIDINDESAIENICNATIHATTFRLILSAVYSILTII